MRSWKGKCIAFLGLCALWGISSQQAQAQAKYYTYSEDASWTKIHDDFRSSISGVSFDGVTKPQIAVSFGDSVNWNFPLYTDGGNVEVDAFRRYQTWVGGGTPGDPSKYKATVGGYSLLGWEAALTYPGGSVQYNGSSQVGGIAQLVVSSTLTGHNTDNNTGSVDCSLNGSNYAHLPGNMKITASGSLTGTGRGHHWGQLQANFPNNTHL